MGGNYAGGAQSSLDAAKRLSARIDNLGRFNPIYNGKTPVYNAPELSSYIHPEAIQASMVPGGNTAANPSLALLLGLDQQDKRQQLL